jgi:hypothetical protein
LSAVLVSLLSQVPSKGAAFEGYSAGIMSNSFGGDVIDMLDMDDVTQFMELMGIATNHKLVLKATFAGWQAAFEALAAAKVAPPCPAAPKIFNFCPFLTHSAGCRRFPHCGQRQRSRRGLMWQRRSPQRSCQQTNSTPIQSKFKISPRDMTLWPSSPC